MLPFFPFSPFGNMTPYTNNHDLDLNWIMDEMRKFIAMYNDIKNLIDTTTDADIARLDAKKDELLTLMDTWYNTHSSDIAVQLATAIHDFQVAVTAIVDQTLPSIPADYTALSNSVLALQNETPKIMALVTANNKNSDLMYLSEETYTQNGLTFTTKQNKIHISGTSTGVSVFDIFNSRTKNINFPFMKGRRYYIIFDESGVHGLFKQIQYKTTSDGQWQSTYSKQVYNDALAIDIPASYHEYCIRLTCDSSGRTFDTDINFYIIPAIYTLNPMDDAVISSMKEGYMSYRKLYPFYMSDMADFYGVNIVNNDNGISIRGTATSTKTYTVMEDFDNTMFKPNDSIVVDYADPANNVYLEIVPYTGIHTANPVAQSPLLQTQATGSYTIRMPSTFDYIVFRLIIFNGTTYNSNVKVNVHTKDNARRTYFVAKDGTGDFSTIKEAVEEAVKYLNSTVIIKEGQYNLVEEFGESFLDNLQGDYYGMILKNGITLQFSPMAYVSFDYDGQNTWIIENFSPFNTGNDIGFTIDGLNMAGRNCRYLIHDDPRPNEKERYSYNTYKNCNLTMYPSPQYANWKNHQIIGGGLGDNTQIVIDSCIFHDIFTEDVQGYSAVSYHNSSSGSQHYQSNIVVKNCIFHDKNRLVFEGYGDATEKTSVMVIGNNFQNAQTDIVYSNLSADNMNLYQWNNVSR